MELWQFGMPFQQDENLADLRLKKHECILRLEISYANFKSVPTPDNGTDSWDRW
jgi:hypothetical protein